MYIGRFSHTFGISRGSYAQPCAAQLLPRLLCRQRLLQPIVDVGERYFDTAALFDVQIFFRAEHFMASLVVFLPEPQRGGAANLPHPSTELALAPHFIVPAR